MRFTMTFCPTGIGLMGLRIVCWTFARWKEAIAWLCRVLSLEERLGTAWHPSSSSNSLFDDRAWWFPPASSKGPRAQLFKFQVFHGQWPESVAVEWTNWLRFRCCLSWVHQMMSPFSCLALVENCQAASLLQVSERSIELEMVRAK